MWKDKWNCVNGDHKKMCDYHKGINNNSFTRIWHWNNYVQTICQDSWMKIGTMRLKFSIVGKAFML